MSTARNDGRPDRRPSWLQQKHSRQSADPKLAAWADRTLEVLAADRTQARAIFARDPETARRWKNALYDAAYKRWNRTHPDDQLSLSANVIDPGDGMCKARGSERCSQNGCEPTPGRHGVHARVHAKSAGRAHIAPRLADGTADYDPMKPRARRPAADNEPQRAFGNGPRGPVHQDPPPAGPSGRGAPPASTRQTTRPSGSAQAAPRKDHPEGWQEKLRRWVG